jgi:hypothetical protein
VLVSITLVPRKMQLGFQAIPKNVMQDRYKYIGCSVNRIVGYVRGLPLLVGLKLGMLASLSSELWFGASVDLLVMFIWSSGTFSVDSGEIS